MAQNNEEIIKEEMDAGNYYSRQVFAHYGAAMYKCQCVERGLATVMCTVFPPKDRILNKTMYDNLLSSHYKHTFGQLIKKLREHINVSEDIVVLLNKALAIRNHLTHSYFFQNATTFMSHEGRLKMVQELRAMDDSMDALNDKMTAMVDGWAKEHGASDGWLGEEVAKLMSSEAHFSENTNQ